MKNALKPTKGTHFSQRTNNSLESSLQLNSKLKYVCIMGLVFLQSYSMNIDLAMLNFACLQKNGRSLMWNVLYLFQFRLIDGKEMKNLFDIHVKHKTECL